MGIVIDNGIDFWCYILGLRECKDAWWFFRKYVCAVKKKAGRWIFLGDEMGVWGILGHCG